MSITIEEIRQRSAASNPFTPAGMVPLAMTLPPIVPVPPVTVAPAVPITEHEITAAELEEWNRRTAPDRTDEADALSDPLWRLANLYDCTNEDGRVVRFVPT